MQTIGKMKNQLQWKFFFGFSVAFEKLNKQLGFHLIFKTADIPDVIYTTSANYITVTLNNLYLLLPILIPDAGTQSKINISIKINFAFSFHLWFTDRQLAKTGWNIKVILDQPEMLKIQNVQ